MLRTLRNEAETREPRPIGNGHHTVPVRDGGCIVGAENDARETVGHWLRCRDRGGARMARAPRACREEHDHGSDPSATSHHDSTATTGSDGEATQFG